VRVARLFLFPGLLGLLSAPLGAQQRWGIALELGKAIFNGHASSTATSPETTGHPSPATTWGLRVSRNGPKVGFSLGLLVANTGVQFESEEAAVETRSLLELLEVSPQVSFVLLRPREAALRVHLGAVLDHWSPEGGTTRTSLGGLGGLSLDVPFSSRFSAEVRWESILTESIFEEAELPPEFNLKSGWSERWILAVRYGL
jgi:hypothetical protein